MRRRFPWRSIAPAALLLSAACVGAPPPPPAPAAFTASGTAILGGGPAAETYLFGRGYVTVTRIDDTTLVDGDNKPLYGVIEIAGGLHTVYFTYRYSSLSRDRKLALDAQAGHVYRVGATYRDGNLWTWISDESDNRRVVAGETPSGEDWAAGVRGFGGG